VIHGILDAAMIDTIIASAIAPEMLACHRPASNGQGKGRVIGNRHDHALTLRRTFILQEHSHRRRRSE
jgi:hypothetical protein